MSEHDWIAPGVPVARVTNGRMGNRRIVWTTIERLTKTLVITEDGERFPRRDLTLQKGGTWGWREVLMRRDDPFVIKLADEIRREQKVNKARALCADFDRSEPKVTAADVILALAPLTGVADEIAALLATTTTTDTSPSDGAREGGRHG